MKVSEALAYLIETDDEYGQLRGEIKGLEHRLKVTKAIKFIESKGKGTIDERKAISESSQEVQAMIESLENLIISMETIAAKRKSRELVIEVWRSQNANKRAGNI